MPVGLAETVKAETLADSLDTVDDPSDPADAEEADEALRACVYVPLSEPNTSEIQLAIA